MKLKSLESLTFNNTFAELPADFYSRVKPTPFNKPPYLVSFNTDVARLIGLDPDEAQREDLLQYISGAKAWPGSQPLAMLYAGHQFGHYVPQLGDGRAVLLGEVRHQDQNWDLQVKGSGQTPYSRQGDGRAVLRSSIREYLCSEAIHGLGIPTTRALCMLGSHEEVYRENIETGAMLVRVAQSHVRFGSFEVFFYREQHAQIKTLADYVIEHHYPHLAEEKDKYVLWLREIVKRTARLMAQWQAVGFSHGVMNTDNMSILGLTLDYGPFGFMDAFNPGYICNHSDHSGRYAFDQQPGIGLWNLTCLAQALTPLITVDAAKQALEDYEPEFIHHYYDLMRAKLGLKETNEQSVEITNDLLALLTEDARDYTNTLRALSDFKLDDANMSLRDRFISRLAFDKWAEQYQARLHQEHSDDAQRKIDMDQRNPKYILRNHLAQVAIEKAERDKDFNEIDRLLELLKDPFSERPGFEHYADEPPDWAQHIEVSCSS
jgi:serine/tyrosine/threonine adenylyltransferase